MSADTRDAITFAMPSLGADMTEGRITEWLVQPGDRIERGQVVLIVETDKSDIDVEVFEPATVLELLVHEGDLVAVGTPIARFGSDAAPRSPKTREREPAPAPASIAHVTSPVIRHLAEELHVDADGVRGTGPGGRVHRDDVHAAAHPQPGAAVPLAAAADRTDRATRFTPRARRLMLERGIDAATLDRHGVVTGDDVLAVDVSAGDATTPTAAPVATAAERPTRQETMRRHIADLMTRSWHEIPHYHVTRRVDLSAVTERLAAVNDDRPLSERVLPGALLLAATARAAAKVTACNGWWRDGVFQPAPGVDLGVVLSLRSGGVIVPTIERADQLTPAEMMARLSELVQRARQGRLRASDVGEASITVTNLGDLGADAVFGVIHPPQVAIVGFGAVHDEVWAIDGTAVVRPTVHASLAGDHRATDGLAGSRFLAHLQAALDRALPDEL